MKKLLVKLLKKMYRLIKEKDTKEESEADSYRQRGVKIGAGSVLYNVVIDGCFGYLISIGENCTITHSTILAHDASTKRILGYSKISPVSIGDNCFIGWNTTILPGVVIGNNVIIGAGSVVTKKIPDGSVACGNPAKVIGNYDEYINKNRSLLMAGAPVYNTLYSEKTTEEKEMQCSELKNGKIGFDL